MTAQVIFLNTQYYPDEEEQFENDRMQEFLHFANIKFIQDQKGVDPAILRQRKEALHRRARERLHIVQIGEP